MKRRSALRDPKVDSATRVAMLLSRGKAEQTPSMHTEAGTLTAWRRGHATQSYGLHVENKERWREPESRIRSFHWISSGVHTEDEEFDTVLLLLEKRLIKQARADHMPRVYDMLRSLRSCNYEYQPSLGACAHAEEDHANCHGSPSSLPKEFVCPISHDVMQDPVVALDGHTYEREAIEEWLKRSCRSPMTGQMMMGDEVIPNFTLRSMIHNFISIDRRVS
ncbi:hypothetical protein GUITHDRAFT_154289 [Guillardia theta CCMP2712]|uniref:U-box domain-containing protein n=2 Tax=Guillardia theta TaxID=55529 RepID=L1IVD8_GUITC|nr:hypothetical protein GUITHDRAFT_154289 [Guillardia theta CCMP2712]EKX39780.1 hypothetical protein GUITHDRAFT_154289 [Guillardia theta CCMP2712]|eukprot:XP_005826760.1 hypothetical protein GUITHDRAFT_154289 [Guillardia theta CCMP2712]